MEHKIGEIVTLPDGRKAEVVARDTISERCYGCMFWSVFFGCQRYKDKLIYVRCSAKVRTDHKSVIYKEIKEDKI